MASGLPILPSIPQRFENKLIDFITSKRLCFKHMRQFVIKNKLQNKDADSTQLLGFCEKCKKAGIVYYLEYKNRSKLELKNK